ncbi:CLIP-associating protein 2 [Ilyodon furcidens]|uniref:CLIP-associating protein 2 n=1 Tax=Ilyodon furcidens TaxID=33524 RepID=A0ABV0UHB7_9TELE
MCVVVYCMVFCMCSTVPACVCDVLVFCFLYIPSPPPHHTRPAPAVPSVPARGGASSVSLQRSRSDVDVNAAAVAKYRHVGQTRGANRLPPGSYSSLGTRSDNGRVRTKQPLSTASTAPSQVDSRGRSRTKMVSQSQRKYFFFLPHPIRACFKSQCE